MKFGYGMQIRLSALDLVISVISDLSVNLSTRGNAEYYSPFSKHMYQLLVLNLNALFVFVTDRPIASIAFHAEGEILAVASGHKVF